MKYKLLAPVRTDFSIVSEAPIRDPDRYAAFWDEVAARKPSLHPLLSDAPGLSENLDEIRFPHASQHRRSPFNRYQSLESDSLERPIHVLEIELGKPALAKLTEPSAESSPALRIERVIWRIFDHGISLLEVDIDLGDFVQTIRREQVPVRLKALQQTGVVLGERLARRCTETLLQPLFEWLHDIPASAAYIESDTETRGHNAHGTVLWVTRTLILEPGEDTHREAIIRYWLKDTGPAEAHNGTAGQSKISSEKKRIEQVVRDDSQHFTQWLNYLFREGSYPADSSRRNDQPGLARPFCDAWEGMLHAQFFYGALDIVDLHLTRILAQSFARDSALQIDQLKALLEQNIRKANLLLLQFHDSAKYYKRAVKSELDAILDYWDFETVLVEPVQQKITLCQERLTLLHQKEAARSAIYTDVILLGIGITSIFGTSLALAEYGRTMATDADLGSYDVNSANFIDWFAALPTDVILVGSSILSLLLVVLYAYYRKRQTL